jgi:hypothetical protein
MRNQGAAIPTQNYPIVKQTIAKFAMQLHSALTDHPGIMHKTVDRACAGP